MNDVRIIALPATNPFAAAENGTFPSGRTNHLFNTKVDHRFNDQLSLFARYAFDDQFILRNSNTTSDSRQGDDYSTTHSAVAEGTAILSDRLVNSLRVHFLTQNVGTLTHSTAPGVTRPSIGTGPAATWPQAFPRKKTTVGETLYYTTARHDIKVGGDYSYSTGSYESYANNTGQFTFTTDLPFDVNNRATWPISLVMQTPGKYSFASSQIALYAQDNWRIADRVRLNLGLRYDYDTDLRHENFYKDLLANPAYAGIENFVSDDRGNDTNNLQPRVGATWDVFGSATAGRPGRLRDVRHPQPPLLPDGHAGRHVEQRRAHRGPGAAEPLPRHQRDPRRPVAQRVRVDGRALALPARRRLRAALPAQLHRSAPAGRSRRARRSTSTWCAARAASSWARPTATCRPAARSAPPTRGR